MQSTETNATHRTHARWRLAIVTVLLLGTAIVLWRFTPLAELASVDHLLERIGDVEDSARSVALTLAAFLIGGLIFFPLTVLITLTALMFEAPLALAVSFAGTLGNAVLTYAVGAKLLRHTAHAAAGSSIKNVTSALASRGVIAVATIRMVPVAPFTLVNLAAGCIGVQLRDYVLGTALGVAPGILMITYFGDQLQELARNPSWTGVLTLVAIIVGWILLSLLLQRAVTRYRSAER